MATCLPHKNGMLEYWNVGGRVEITHFSKWGEVPEFYLFGIQQVLDMAA
jgi:hypothetical protein